MNEPNAQPTAAGQLFRHSRREARIVGIVWALSLIWTVGYCYVRGYDHSPTCILVRIGLAAPRSAQAIQTWLGFPDWVVFGILLPWILCTLFTFVFSLCWMKDDDLGTDADDGAGHGA